MGLEEEKGGGKNLELGCQRSKRQKKRRRPVDGPLQKSKREIDKPQEKISVCG